MAVHLAAGIAGLSTAIYEIILGEESGVYADSKHGDRARYQPDSCQIGDEADLFGRSRHCLFRTSKQSYPGHLRKQTDRAGKLDAELSSAAPDGRRIRRALYAHPICY
jgi:hypothetical protein